MKQPTPEETILYSTCQMQYVLPTYPTLLEKLAQKMGCPLIRLWWENRTPEEKAQPLPDDFFKPSHLVIK